MTWHRTAVRPSRTTDTVSLLVTALTCAVDRHTHSVTDGELRSGLVHGQGTFQAACGRRITAASLSTPPGPACPHCYDR